MSRKSTRKQPNTSSNQEISQFNNNTILASLCMAIGTISALVLAYSLKGGLTTESISTSIIIFGILALVGLVGGLILAGILWNKQIFWKGFRIILLICAMILLIDGIYTSAFVIYPESFHYEYEQEVQQMHSCRAETRCALDETLAQGCKNVFQTDQAKLDLGFVTIHNGLLGGLSYYLILSFLFVMLFMQPGPEQRSKMAIPLAIAYINVLYSIYLMSVLLNMGQTCVQCIHLYIIGFSVFAILSLYVRNIYKETILDHFRHYKESKSLISTIIILVMFVIMGLLTFTVYAKHIESPQYKEHYKQFYREKFCTPDHSATQNDTSTEDHSHTEPSHESPPPPPPNPAMDFDLTSFEAIEFPINVKAQYDAAPKFEMDLTNTPSKGRDEMGITIVTFKDFQCPACHRFSTVTDELLKRYNYRFQVYYKHFPIENACNPAMKSRGHEGSCIAAYASYAAFKLNKFYDMHDLIYESEVHPIGEDVLLNIAKHQLNFSDQEYEKFLEYYESSEARDIIVRDCQEAIGFGEVSMLDKDPSGAFNGFRMKKVVGGTPTVFVNGVLLSWRVCNVNDLGMIIEELKLKE